MEIKDIVEQGKHKRTLVKIKKREDAITRKQFLKDCYKFWKEYKKVESPYFWWLTLLKIHYWLGFSGGPRTRRAHQGPSPRQQKQ